MGIEVRISTREHVTDSEIIYDGIAPVIDVIQTDSIRHGTVTYSPTRNKSGEKTLVVEAGSNRNTLTQGQGGYARIATNVFHVNMDGPQAIEVTFEPFNISLKATSK